MTTFNETLERLIRTDKVRIVKGAAANATKLFKEYFDPPLQEMQAPPLPQSGVLVRERGRRFPENLADEQAWEAQFEATSADQWDRMAEMARREIAAGNTIPLEDAFPVKVTEG